MYQTLLWKRIKYLLEPVWVFRPSIRLMVIVGGLIFVSMVFIGSTFLDDVLLGIKIRSSTFQESESGAVESPSFGSNLVWNDGIDHKVNENNGKVSVIHFWSSACATCRDAYGRLAEWQYKYNKYGVRVYGIYSPQFDFEVDDPKQYEDAINKYGMKRYPVAIDFNFELTDAFVKASDSFNSSGSVIVIIDKKGFIRHTIIDANNLPNGELVIQALLTEAKVKHRFPLPVRQARMKGKITTNLYFNNEDTISTENFVAKEKLKNGEQIYTLEEGLLDGQWSLGGTWSRNKSSIQAIKNGILGTRITGKRVFIVVGSAYAEDYLGVVIDRESGVYRPPEVDKDGVLKITNSGVYQIIASKKTLNKKDLKLSVPDKLKIYQLIVLPN